MALNFPGRFQGPEGLIGAPQDLTAGWIDLGDQQDVRGADFCAVYLTIDINNSTNVRVRILASHTAAGDEFVLPIKTVGAAAVLVEDHYYEFNVDADQLMVLDWELESVAFTQVQVMAAVVGVAAGQIDTAHMTTGIY